MSRDHYKGTPKKRAALLNSNGELEALSVDGDVKRISGTAVLTAGTVTVSGTRFVEGSGTKVFVSGQHPYPATEGFNFYVGDGYLTISGSSAATYDIVWEAILP